MVSTPITTTFLHFPDDMRVAPDWRAKRNPEQADDRSYPQALLAIIFF